MLKNSPSVQQILSTVESAGIGVWEYDIVTEELFLSDKACEIFGVTPQKFDNNFSTFVELLHPADKDCYLSKRATASRGQESFNITYRIVLPNGAVRHVQEIARIFDSSERKVLSGTIRDVTLEQLQKNRWKLLNTIALKLNDLVIITEGEPIDQSGSPIVYVSDAFTFLTGYERAEVIGRPPSFLHGPNTDPVELARIRAAMTAFQCVRAELVNYTKSGEEIWLESETWPISDDSGLHNQWVTVARDITERKTAEQAMRVSEAQFRASFEAAAVGQTLVDAATARIMQANQAFAQMLGYQPEEIIGRTAWELTWPDDRQAGQAGYEQLTQGRPGEFVREKRYIRRDGTPVWGRVSASVFKTPDPRQPLMTITIVEDIDESRRAKSALETAKHDLEALLAERTAALRQRDLLLREVYHRVKNNLQIVDSLLMMQAIRVSDPTAKSAFISMRGRLYALGLVHQQLMNSSNLSTFDIAPFLLELSENIVEGGAGPGIELVMKVVPLDAGLDFAIPLGLIVTELVTNSLKHAFADAKGTIEISLTQSGDGRVLLVISDNGIGYDVSEHLDPLANNALGTRIVAGMVAQLRGTMVVTSEGGARTEIHLPAPGAS